MTFNAVFKVMRRIHFRYVLQIYSVGPAASDVARHFIQKWNFIRSSKSAHRKSIQPLFPRTVVEYPLFKSPNDTAQMLRSVSPWSMGCPIECSIQEAYIQLIHTSKSYIYIENQFFISNSTGKDGTNIQNTVAMALAHRITLAHRQKDVFHVYVLVPLLPAFESDIADPSAGSVRVVLQAQLTTISRGRNSLLSKLQEATGLNREEILQKYISFYSLRKVQKLGEKYVTEMIYAHSKLMIVDDESAIIGSANINDRSMVGERDCEIALSIKGDSARELRLALFREHMGREYDPNTDFEAIKHLAKINTDLYRTLFSCLPDDQVTNFKNYKHRQEHIKNGSLATINTDSSLAPLLHKIKGHIVEYPIDFLNEEILYAGFLSYEARMPLEIFF